MNVTDLRHNKLSMRSQITVIMLLLARLVHWQPALAGLGATAVLVPLTAAITRKAAAVRKRLVERTDARVKLCTETVTGTRLHRSGMQLLDQSYCVSTFQACIVLCSVC